MEPIKFILGEESRPKIETFSDVKSSLFKDQYEKAFEEISEYIETKSSGFKTITNSENRNNIFAFIGERGSGKTSCMLSVANMLLEANKNFGDAFANNKKINILESQNFHTIDLVDPSFFDQKHNILDIVIAKLFKSFDDDVKTRNSSTQSDYLFKKQKLIEEFQKTKENLNQMLSKDIISDDSIEQLIGLAAGVTLKESMYQLFDSYLDYFSKSDQKNDKTLSHLVLKIDDIDLHTQHAYDMVEQIRKYLIQPNVIVLIAAKIDQLSNVIRLHYTVEFDKLLTSGVISNSYIEEMVDKYLGKLVPLSNRIFLPEATVYINRPLQIYKDENIAEPIFNSIREAVPTLIFKKTRYLFYNSKGATSYIVPRSLRELRHIIKLLFDMNNYLIEVRPEYNKTIFKKYLFETWISNNLDFKGEEIVRNILAVSDAVNFNKNVIRQLKQYYPELFKLVELQKELYSIINDSNLTFNISIGDVFSVILYLESVTTRETDRKLFFIIKSIYSIKLYEYYDEITEVIIDRNSLSEKEVFKSEFMRGYSNYDKIVAGNFINTSYNDVVPVNLTSGSRSTPRSNRTINGEIFFEILGILKKEFDLSLKDRNLKIKYKGRELLYCDALNIIEFFALTISRQYDSKRPAYRIQNSVYYNENLSDVKSNLFFDITSYTYNIIDIKRCYSRFDKQNEFSFYEMCNSIDNSLLNKIYKTTTRHNDKDHNLKSWVCIRNAEVLEHFTQYLQSNKPKGEGLDDKKVLVNFFSTINDYSIQTYDRDRDDQEPYTISFPFILNFVSILNEIDNELFNNIYTSQINVENILNINQRLKDQNQKDTILNRLTINNKHILDQSSLIQLFNTIFTDAKYDKEVAKSKLKELKIKYNG